MTSVNATWSTKTAQLALPEFLTHETKVDNKTVIASSISIEVICYAAIGNENKPQPPKRKKQNTNKQKTQKIVWMA